MYSIEAELKGILKKHGFIIAADMIEFHGISKKAIRSMINSWKDFPKCMEVFPKTLSPKLYNEETHEYTRI